MHSEYETFGEPKRNYTKLIASVALNVVLFVGIVCVMNSNSGIHKPISSFPLSTPFLSILRPFPIYYLPLFCNSQLLQLASVLSTVPLLSDLASFAPLETSAFVCLAKIHLLVLMSEPFTLQ